SWWKRRMVKSRRLAVARAGAVRCVVAGRLASYQFREAAKAQVAKELGELRCVPRAHAPLIPALPYVHASFESEKAAAGSERCGRCLERISLFSGNLVHMGQEIVECAEILEQLAGSLRTNAGRAFDIIHGIAD